MGRFGHLLTLLGVAAVVAGLDLLSKAWARAALPAEIHLHATDRPLLLAPVVAAGLVVATLIVRTMALTLWSALALGGLLGNASELLRGGAVTDWISLGDQAWTNLADLALISACACAMFLVARWVLQARGRPNPWALPMMAGVGVPALLIAGLLVVQLRTAPPAPVHQPPALVAEPPK